MNHFFNLHWFDGEGSANGTADTAGSNAQTAAETEEVAEPQKEADTAEADERIRAYNEFKESNKDLFQKDFDEALNKRFKNQKKLQSDYDSAQKTLDEHKNVFDLLKHKYGVDEDEALLKAIQDDDSFYEQEALEKGISVQQLKAFKQLERENEQLKQAAARQENDKIYNAWLEQAEQTARFYPSFDLAAEINSEETGEQFANLLKSGIDVKTAYEVLHQQEIVSGVARLAAKESEKKIAESIASNSKRAVENGAGGAVSTGKIDISKLTKEQMRDIEKRAARGEKITFK